MSISRVELEKLSEPRKLTVEEKKERLKNYNKKYNKENRDKLNKLHKKWYQKNKTKLITLGAYGIDGYSIKLRQTMNKDGKFYGIGWFTAIQTPEKNRLNASRHKIKDAIVLNECFEGSESHHLAEDVVAFIPKALHQSIRHNLKTGKNMDLINKVALEFVKRQEENKK